MLVFSNKVERQFTLDVRFLNSGYAVLVQAAYSDDIPHCLRLYVHSLNYICIHVGFLDFRIVKKVLKIKIVYDKSMEQAESDGNVTPSDKVMFDVNASQETV